MAPERQPEHRTSERITRARAMALAEDYYDGGRGWSIEALRRHFAERGVVVGWATVKRWADPVVAERQRRDTAARTRARYRDQHGLRTARVFDQDALLRRVRALDEAGVPSASIAAVIRLDHGVLLTGNRVTRILAGDPVPARVLAAVA